MSKPIFVIGAPRSGTTLLRLILNSHSDVSISRETAYFERCERLGQLESWRKPAMSEEKYAALVHGFLHWYNEKGAGLDVPALEQLCLEDNERSMRSLFRHLLEADAAKNEKVRIGEKTPLHSFFVDCMYDMFPDALFVNIVRDPRAVVASMNRLDLFTDSSIINGFNWRTVMRRGRALIRRVIPLEQRLELRFEDLVTDPETTVRAVCEFIGEQYEDSMLSYHQEGLAHVSSQSPGWGTDRNLARGITKEAVRTWARELSETQIRQIEWVCHKEMEELGYVREYDMLGFRQRALAATTLAYCSAKRLQNRDRRSHLITYRPLQRFRRRSASAT